MLRAILNKSWRHQLYGHLPPITKTIQVRRTRHAGHCWRSKDELISDVLLWTPTYGRAKAGRPARTYIQQLCEDTDVALKTYQKRWTIGRSGERGSGISVPDDDDYLSVYHMPEIRVLTGIYFVEYQVPDCPRRYTFYITAFYRGQWPRYRSHQVRVEFNVAMSFVCTQFKCQAVLFDP